MRTGRGRCRRGGRDEEEEEEEAIKRTPVHVGGVEAEEPTNATTPIGVARPTRVLHILHHDTNHHAAIGVFISFIVTFLLFSPLTFGDGFEAAVDLENKFNYV